MLRRLTFFILLAPAQVLLASIMATSSDGSAAQCLCMSAECSICGTPAVVHCTAPSVAPVCYCMSTHCAVCGGQPASLSATSSQTAAIDGRKKTTLAADIEDDSDSDDYPLGAKAAMELAQPRCVSFSALECIGRPRGERWDFWEMHGGCCAFTTAVIARGLRAGPAVDNKPAGLTGPPCLQVDILNRSCQTLLWQLWVEARPQWAHVAWPCTYWTSLGRTTALRTDLEWEALAVENRNHVKFSTHMLQCQAARHCKGTFEQPARSVALRKNRVMALQSQGFLTYTFPMCAWGLHNPGTGKAWKKSSSWGSNADLSFLERECCCENGHDVISGFIEVGSRKGQSKASVSGEYPMELCSALADTIAATVCQ